MTRRAGIYVRISSDPEGLRLGVTRQLDECRAKAAAMRWDVVDEYEDNDRSATGGKVREHYQRMLADLHARKIDAVVVWDLDRLTRRPIELEEFLAIADRHNVALASVGGDVDLSTDNGRMFARIKGAVARAEVERKSARQRSANSQRAASGAPHAGRRAFGYTADGRALVEAEAAEVRAAAESLLAGNSVRGIAAGMTTRGVVTTAGGSWRPTEVRRMLGNPRYAGLRVHRGEVVGPGAWPSVLDEATHAALVAVLASPERHKAGPPRRYLLSGIARCGVCGGRMFGVTEKQKGAMYRCETRRHVTLRADAADGIVVQTMLRRLARADAIDVLTHTDGKFDVAALREKEGALRARLADVAEAYAAGEIDRAQLRTATAALRQKIEETEQALSRFARVPVLSDLLTSTDVAASWETLPLDRQRAAMTTLMNVVLHPPGRGARVFNPETVEITWKTTAAA